MELNCTGGDVRIHKTKRLRNTDGLYIVTSEKYTSKTYFYINSCHQYKSTNSSGLNCSGTQQWLSFLISSMAFMYPIVPELQGKSQALQIPSSICKQIYRFTIPLPKNSFSAREPCA